MKTLYMAVRFPALATYAGNPNAVTGEMLFVDPVHHLCADLPLGGANTSLGFDAGDGCSKGGAGDPEARWHLRTGFVFYHAREAERTASGYAEGDRLAAQLECYGLVVVQATPLIFWDDIHLLAGFYHAIVLAGGTLDAVWCLKLLCEPHFDDVLLL